MINNSVLETLIRDTEEKLDSQAVGRSRRYFRASELARCPRAVAYAMRGEDPRPFTIEAWSAMRAGEALHGWAQEWIGGKFVLDLIEGVSTNPATDGYVESKGGTAVVSSHNPNQRNLHFDVEHRGKVIPFHFRTDGVIIGEDERVWPESAWSLVEIKTTTDWGVVKARQSKEWWPSFQAQAQISMHCLGLKDTFILQIGREHLAMVGDMYQPAGSAPMKGKWGDFEWTRLAYDEGYVEALLDWCTSILDTLDTEEQPPCDPQCFFNRGYIYNGCSYNAAKTRGRTSGPMCKGNV